MTYIHHLTKNTTLQNTSFFSFVTLQTTNDYHTQVIITILCITTKMKYDKMQKNKIYNLSGFKSHYILT